MGRLDNDVLSPASASRFHDLCIHELFERQVSEAPESVAIIDGDVSMTYAELDERADRIARSLRQLDVGPEVIVGCHLGRSAAVVPLILAVLKAGGMYLLLDPLSPARRLAHIVGDAQPALVVTDCPVPAELAQIMKKVVTPRQLDVAAATPNARGPRVDPGVRPDNAAYIAYTSGSTGRPKGVVITHRSTVNHCVDFAQRFKLDAVDRVPIMAPIAFDVATEEIIPALIAGSALIVSPSRHDDMREFNDEIIQRRYTVLNIPAPLWHEWTEYLLAARLPVPPSLRLVIVGSDKIYTSHFQDWKRLPGASEVDWVAAYGTTETTVTSSFYTTAWDDDLSDEPCVPIGRPIDNVRLHIFDERGRPVRPGVAGELHIGGLGVARGYHKRPDLTRQRFVPDPFSERPDARLYRTGDQARAWPDGTVVWIGRKDLQVKIRGLRIELGEIEAVLTEHSAVSEAVVVMGQRCLADREKLLVAFVTLRPGASASSEELRGFAAAHLHRHMVPARFVELPSLPINANGKLDRRLLEDLAVDLGLAE